MNVLMLSPGYPAEMPEFTRGLAEVGATVVGVGDQPLEALPERARRSLAAYVRVRSLFDEAAAVAEVRRELAGRRIDRVESLWEPLMLLAARLREALGVPGLDVAATVPFRDKEAMKLRLDAAGIRTPRHVAAASVAACWEAAERIGFPVILKPIAGAGSADTWRCDDADDLRAVLPRVAHVPVVSVEEFVDGEEYTFDTVTIAGSVAYYNVAWYRPRPLIARTHEWISPQVIALRDPDAAPLAGGVAMGHAVIRALGFETGFTHMEWYRKADGEVVFGEIGARPPGAHQVDQMNYACDFDVFREWARAVTAGRFDARIERRYNVATVFKRAQGEGTIRAIEGLEALYRRWGEAIAWNHLLPVGARRRNWKQTLVSDGFLLARHPDLATTLAIADEIGERVRLHAR
ncbi:MAG: ATP-grasp domain-containing protein [Proteobacteria bacterium]|nr:ATP-grasp domain-containing protein [Pseudomonadota bacterium]